jgi:hypothetical protein
MNKLKGGKNEVKGSQGPKLAMGRWIVEHDPELYVYKNYGKALSHLKEGLLFQNTNMPTGLDSKPWTIDGLLEAQEKGESTILDGNWS